MWVRDREYDIYTLVKTRASKILGTKYKDLYFTQDDEQIVETQLPTVYIHNLPGRETARTINGKSLNVMDFRFEIIVTVSKKQGQKVASEVIWEIIAQFKKFGFEIMQSPSPMRSNNAAVQQFVARAHRQIGASDSIQY